MLLCRRQAELGEFSLDGRGEEPREEGVGFGFVGGFGEDDGALADLGILRGRDQGVHADLLEVRSGGDGKREEAELGVAGFDELRGLRDVFCDDKLGLEAVVELEVPEGGSGSESIGSVQFVSDGDLGHAGVGKAFEGQGKQAGVFAGP